MVDRCCISLNNYCNLNCRYCYFYNREDINVNALSIFSLDEVKKIVANIYSYTIEKNSKFKIGIVGSGEPLMSFDIIKGLVEWVRLNNMSNRLSFYTISNGYKTSKEKLDFFYRNRDIISLSFSLDGYKELHDFARVKKTKDGYVGTYDNVFATIQMYEDIFGKKPAINVTVHKKTINNCDRLIGYLYENKFSNVTFSRLVDSTESDMEISKDEFNAFIEKLDRINNSRGESDRLSIRNIEVKGNKVDCTMYGAACGVGKTNIYFADKKIYPCGRFTGNLNYVLGRYDDCISNVESNFGNVLKIGCNDDACYYDKCVREE